MGRWPWSDFLPATRTALVPRIMPDLGLAGAPLLVASITATTFDLWDQVSVFAAIAAAPIALWELSLDIWLVTKGFRPDPIDELGTVTNHPIKVRLAHAPRPNNAPDTPTDGPVGSAARLDKTPDISLLGVESA